MSPKRPFRFLNTPLKSSSFKPVFYFFLRAATLYDKRLPVLFFQSACARYESSVLSLSEIYLSVPNMFFYFVDKPPVRLLKSRLSLSRASAFPIIWINLVSWKLPTHPCPKPTLSPTSHLGQNVGLGEG